MAEDEFGFRSEAGAANAAAEEAEGEKETGRIEAFSDGVFAIATTLLVLEIHVPLDPANGEALRSVDELWKQLLHLWPHYLAYLMGFSMIVIMWINHHGLFRLIRRSTHGLLLWNSLLLLVISLVPFLTALVSDYISPLESETARLALAIYSAWGFVIALCYNFLWWYMSGNNRLINRKADPKEVWAVTQSYFFGPILYLLGLGAAVVDAHASLVVNLALAVFFALPSRVAGSLAATMKRRA
jgi:uncharacterized membrane protein